MRSLKRDRTAAERIRDVEEELRGFLHGATGAKSPMYAGLTPNNKHLHQLCTMLNQHMMLLATATSGRDWRGFGALANWGPIGMQKFINTDETWEQNLARLNEWVTKFEVWLESPLDRMARAAGE